MSEDDKEETKEIKLDLSKVRKNSRDYKNMTDEQRAEWNEYQKEKQRQYRAKRKAEREQLEEEVIKAKTEEKIPDEGTIEANESLYICSDCGQSLKGGEATCPKCGVLCDWRGTDIESGDAFVVCNVCGYAMPVNQFKGKCDRCGWTGK